MHSVLVYLKLLVVVAVLSRIMPRLCRYYAKFWIRVFLFIKNCGIQRHIRVHPKSTVSPAECFKFRVEERLQCLASGQVRYKYR